MKVKYILNTVLLILTLMEIIPAKRHLSKRDTKHNKHSRKRRHAAKRRMKRNVQSAQGFDALAFQEFKLPASVLQQEMFIENVKQSGDTAVVLNQAEARSSSNSNTTSSADSPASLLRKFRQLKSMIMFLQKVPDFGKYCYYGCWCFIEGSYNLQTGYGPPRDEIDQSCMRFSKCYRCLAMDYPNFRDSISYSFSAETNNRGKKSVTCNDPEGTVKRNLCECDRELAIKLAEHEDKWTEKFHEKWGNFDRRHECHSPVGGFTNDDCCGRYPNRYPYSTRNGTRKCCGNKVYGLEYFQCCNNNILSSDQTCSD